MIGRRLHNRRGVSGAGGSCFYRAISYQLCERSGRAYHDDAEVSRLRGKVRDFLLQNANSAVPTNPQLRWKDLGSYMKGYAEAPVPQATAYVVRCPIIVHLGKSSFKYGSDMPGKSLHVRLAGMHYSIEYPIQL